MSLLDLFDDEPAAGFSGIETPPKPEIQSAPPAPKPQPVQRPAPAMLANARPGRTFTAEPRYTRSPGRIPAAYLNHDCACGVWGCYGLGDVWYCRAHVPRGYLPKDRGQPGDQA